MENIYIKCHECGTITFDVYIDTTQLDKALEKYGVLDAGDLYRTFLEMNTIPREV